MEIFCDKEYWSLISERDKKNNFKLDEDGWVEKIDGLIRTSINNRKKIK